MTMLSALPLWRARGPRFLLLLVMAWIVVRAGAQWPVPRASEGSHPTVFADGPIGLALPKKATNAVAEKSILNAPRRHTPVQFRQPQIGSFVLHPAARVHPAQIWSLPDRHRWRFALVDKWLMAQRLLERATAAMPPPSAADQRQFPPGQAVSPPPPPLWPKAAGGRWSLDAYSYWRGGTGPAPLGGAGAPGLGGSQSAARIDYALGSSRRARLFTRLTGSPVGGGQADVAVGAAFRPLAAVPVDLMAEHRLPIAGGGRAATLVYAAGGVSQVALPHDLQLSAYGQGGVAVRAQAPVQAFADAALSIERPLAQTGDLHLLAGAMTAAAAQPGARRVDVGPRATLQLDGVGKGARLSLDWRARVAGNAQPASGLAVTLSAGF